MTSQFDMNKPPHVCQICLEMHRISNRCKYERLVSLIHTQKQSMMSMIKGNKEIINLARDFQNIIIKIEPELVRLYEVEKLYRESIGEVFNGPTHLQTEASQLSIEGV